MSKDIFITDLRKELEDIQKITDSIGNYRGVTKEKFAILEHISNALNIINENDNNMAHYTSCPYGKDMANSYH